VGHGSDLNQEINLSVGSSPKLHLLFSVVLTNEPLPGALSYGAIPSQNQNKVDQFLSVIDTISKFHFYSVELYLEFEGEYLELRKVAYSRIYELFPTAIIYSHRLETFRAWKEASEKISKDVDLILLKTNHDHAFVHESYEDFAYFLQDLHSLGPRSLGAISHWPEMIGQQALQPVPSIRPTHMNLLKKTNWTIGTCLVSREFFEEWWQDDFTNGERITRPDNPFGASVKFDSVAMLIPPREFFRHLDGYGHVDLKSPSAAPLRACCKIVNGEVIHKDWKYGRFYFGGRGNEIPALPKTTGSNSLSSYIDLVLLASSHQLNLSTLYVLLKNTSSPNHKLWRLAFLVALTNVHVFSKLPRVIFRSYILDSIRKMLKKGNLFS